MPQALLEVENLKVEFKTDDGTVRAVEGVSFEVAPGETLGLVGESGSGKSVTNLALMGLVPSPPGRVVSGEARFHGKDLLKMSRREIARIRGQQIAMIFQDPMTSLNPFLTIERQMTELTQRHLKLKRPEARRHALEKLDRVGIPSPESRLDDYPHELSGGMRQRVMIAMALSCKPSLLIADEPTTALDVTIQSQILELIDQLQKEEGTSVILITHDLGVVAGMCPRVAVMYAGRIVEEAGVDDLFYRPRHPYTRGLLDSIPRLDRNPEEMLRPITGQPPDLIHLPRGCAFRPRCPNAVEVCRMARPPLEREGEHRRVACYHRCALPEDATAGMNAEKKPEKGEEA
jgi:oligopeptide transport system ATP-binding protein